MLYDNVKNTIFDTVFVNPVGNAFFIFLGILKNI